MTRCDGDSRGLHRLPRITPRGFRERVRLSGRRHSFPAGNRLWRPRISRSARDVGPRIARPAPSSRLPRVSDPLRSTHAAWAEPTLLRTQKQITRLSIGKGGGELMARQRLKTAERAHARPTPRRGPRLARRFCTQPVRQDRQGGPFGSCKLAIPFQTPERLAIALRPKCQPFEVARRWRRRIDRGLLGTAVGSGGAEKAEISAAVSGRSAAIRDC